MIFLEQTYLFIICCLSFSLESHQVPNTNHQTTPPKNGHQKTWGGLESMIFRENPFKVIFSMKWFGEFCNHCTKKQAETAISWEYNGTPPPGCDGKDSDFGLADEQLEAKNRAAMLLGPKSCCLRWDAENLGETVMGGDGRNPPNPWEMAHLGNYMLYF